MAPVWNFTKNEPFSLARGLYAEVHYKLSMCLKHFNYLFSSKNIFTHVTSHFFIIDQASLDHGLITESLQSLDLNYQNVPDHRTSSRVGDSGYVSFPGGLPISFGHLEQYSRIAESEVDEVSNATQTEIVDNVVEGKASANTYVSLESGSGNLVAESAMSVVSSQFLEDRDLSGDNWKVPTPQVLEQLSRSGKKGSLRSEVQLR